MLIISSIFCGHVLRTVKENFFVFLMSVSSTSNVPASIIGSSGSNDDDKYVKAVPRASNPGPEKKDDNKYTKRPTSPSRKCPEDLFLFFGFACFVALSGMAYTSVGRAINLDNFVRFCSSNLEILGLLLLAHKIKVRNSADGVSGNTMIMYGFVYGLRIWLTCPEDLNFEWKDLDFDASFGFASLLLTLEIARHVFWTHRETYDEELDVVKAKYLIPMCFALGIILPVDDHVWLPEDHDDEVHASSKLFGYFFCTCLCMDVLALLPQVVMMAQGGGKVAVPIAHFVAATFVSRVGDVFNSLVYESHLRFSHPTAYWTVVILQFMYMFLVADFMYYYMKLPPYTIRLEDELKIIEMPGMEDVV